MADILTTIGELVWLGYFAALFIFFVLALKNAQINSSLIAMTVTVIVVWLMDHYRDLLLVITAEEHKTLVRFFWYIGFTALDALLMYSIYKIHVVFKKTYSLITRVILLSFFVAGLLQLIRLTERHFFATDLLKPLYRWGIVSINISTMAVVFSVALMAAVRHYYRQPIKGAL